MTNQCDWCIRWLPLNEYWNHIDVTPWWIFWCTKDRYKKESIWQTVYEQLQEIQDKIGDRSLSTWCIVFNKEWGQHKKHKVLSYTMKTNWEFDVVCDWYELYDLLEWNIIWHPISLSRVLSALGEKYWYVNWVVWIINSHNKEDSVDRKLLTEDWGDAMLDNQSPETIKAIWEIVCKS